MSTQSAFDPDAYLGAGTGGAPAAFDPDTYLAQRGVPRGASPSASAPQPPSLADQQTADVEEGLTGAWQTARSIGQGLAGSIAGGARGIFDLATLQGSEKATADVRATQADLGYTPPAGSPGAAVVHALGSGYNPLNWPDILGREAGDWSAGEGGAPPLVSAALRIAPDALAALAGGGAAREFGAGAQAPASAEEVLSAQAARSGQSMGAAAAAPRITDASPQLQQAVLGAAQRTGGAVNSDALARHFDADTLPVPIQLTKGQALQDPTTLSIEQNARGSLHRLCRRFNEQNGQLTQNLQALRDEAGPDVFSTNPVEHGDTLIGAYQAKDAAAQAGIDAKYQALRDGAGGQFPVDAGQILSNSTQALHNQLLFEHAPPAVMSQLSGMAESGMTFEQFEALRTNLATIQRTSSDGLERRAAGVIRDQMEQLPLEGGAATLKPLADQARAAARQHFQDLEADPAYAAAVDGSVSPDKFVQRFVTGPSSTRDGVATMRANLADDPVASQTLGVAAIDHLRRSAGIDDLGNGNFSQANFNKQLQQLGPRLPSLVDPKIANQLSQVGEVARYTQAQPRGSFVNNSNTFTAAAGEHAKNALEAVVNAQAGGIPVATWVRKAAAMRQFGKMEAEHLKPGAGLTVLPGQ